jgi:SAM-dependent methyltransferase
MEEMYQQTMRELEFKLQELQLSLERFDKLKAHRSNFETVVEFGCDDGKDIRALVFISDFGVKKVYGFDNNYGKGDPESEILWAQRSVDYLKEDCRRCLSGEAMELIKLPPSLKKSIERILSDSTEIKFSTNDVTKTLPIADETVDLVYSSHMLYHIDNLEDLKSALSEAYRILKRSGFLYAIEPSNQLGKVLQDIGFAQIEIDGTTHIFRK